GAITAVKGIAGIARIIESMKGIKSGTMNITESLSMAGAMPVYVTNWGGGAGLGIGTGNTFTGTGIPAAGGGLVDQYGNPLSTKSTPAANRPAANWKRRLPAAKTSAVTAAGVQAVFSAIGLAAELYDLSKNETLSDDERRKIQGGAVGDSLGSVGGAAAGAFIGSIILPGVGTIIGGMIGSQLGGMGGRWAGETLGAWKDRTQRELEAAQTDYEKALQESADTLGKTEEEIENVRRRLAEAETRLEKARQADEAKKAGYEALVKTRLNEYSHRGGRPQTDRTGNDAAVTYGGYVYRGYRRPVNDLIVTPQGQFTTHPDDYIIAMKNPAALAGSETRTVEHVPQITPPVIAGGEIKLFCELVIDDKEYRMRQSVVKNTTPYKFAAGNSREAGAAL
ncbi:MAG: hypothetical protein LBQ14_08735, partial [Treponema sp.]|nr:hypothetical protein [Treponema sp.]